MSIKTHGPKSISKKINVWLVDDDPRYSRTVTEALNETRTVRCDRCFDSCETFLSVLKTEVDRPSVILLDIRMPGINGLVAIPAIKEISPLSKVIILTAFDNESYVLNAVREGAEGFLLKDSSQQEMTNAILAVAAGGIKLDDRATSKLCRILARCQPLENRNELTQREKEILRLLAQGLSRRDICQRLSLSYFTIETHFKNLHLKMNVHSDIQLLLLAMGLAPD